MSICFAIERKSFQCDESIESDFCYRTESKRIKGEWRCYPVNNYRAYYEIKCTCGMRGLWFSLNENSKVKECPRCSTKDIVTLEKLFKSKMFNSTFTVEENNDEVLIVKSKRNKVLVKKDDKLEIKNIGEDTLYFEKTIGKLHVMDYRDVRFDKNTKPSLKTWFNRVDFDANLLFESITRDEKDLEYINFLYDKFRENGSYYSYYGEKSLEKTLNYYYKHPLLEKLYKVNFDKEFIYTLGKDWGMNYSVLRMNEKKLHKVFDLSKPSLEVIKRQKYFNSYNIKEIRDIEKVLSSNNIKEIVKIFDEEVPKNKNVNLIDLINYIKKLNTECDYNNIKALATYICRRTKLEQGLDNPLESARLLYDYIRVMKELEFDYEKYPQSLKKVHDIAVMNKNALKEVNTNIGDFEEIVFGEDYISLEQKGKVFSVIAPKSPNDVIKEGDALSHCVASYVKDIANGICKILFLRLTADPEESYMTIEVRNNEIKQFRGLSNRDATENDWAFIREWAKEKNLILAGS